MEEVRYLIVFFARGHPNVSATHRTTLEVTREEHLTPRGTCIIGVSSQMACSDLPEEVKRRLREGARVEVRLFSCGVSDVVRGRGDSRLTLSSPTSIVLRRSDYVDDRTLAVRCDKAARDISRRLVEALRRGARLRVEIAVY